MSDKPEDIIQEEVTTALALTGQLDELERRLSESKEFRKFLELQKTVPAKLEETWKQVESQMLEHNIKSIKGDWGSLTIAERLSFDVDLEELPRKFTKTVADTKKIADTYRLEGKSPRGTTPKTTKYLTKRLK